MPTTVLENSSSVVVVQPKKIPQMHCVAKRTAEGELAEKKAKKVKNVEVDDVKMLENTKLQKHAEVIKELPKNGKEQSNKQKKKERREKKEKVQEQEQELDKNEKDHEKKEKEEKNKWQELAKADGVSTKREEKTNETTKKRERNEDSEEQTYEAVNEKKRNENAWLPDLCKEHSITKKATDEQVIQWRKSNTIAVAIREKANGCVHDVEVGGNEFRPFVSFEAASASFSQQILESCKDFKQPTPIQSACWPAILRGKDVIGVAETGSGKTLAFTLPALLHVQQMKSRTKEHEQRHSKNWRMPMVLILSPTRELAMQIEGVASAASKHCNTRSICLYGGVPKDGQRKALQSGVEIIVGTPGRVQDLIDDGNLLLSQISYVVLDEADRMLDMGFAPAINAILSRVPKKRQTLMFTATWPKEIQSLGDTYLRACPVKITVGQPELSATHSVTQIVEVLQDHDKTRRLVELLKKYHATRKNRVLVFALYKKEASRLEQHLQQRGWNAVAIHGDKDQNARTAAFNKFRDGTVPLLIATDVAARGLDIPDVEYVINVTFPLTIEDYIHRIGRTGRAGKTGTSHTFFTVTDKNHSGELINVLREANQEVPESLLKFGTTVKKKEHALYGAHFKEISAHAKPKHVVF